LAKGPNAFRTISEAADEVGVPQHVLRFWETRFSFIRPMKRAGGRRFYRPQDVTMLQGLKARLHDDGLSIKDIQKIYKEDGLKRVLSSTVADHVPTEVPIAPMPIAPAPVAELLPWHVEPQSHGGRRALNAESQMRLQLTLAGLLATKQRLDDILHRQSA